ncbi:ABC transporter ATP-binding protein [Desulfoluna spongiiphila]|uniref:ABC transporter ATP-binding protein n=1 Tax=Desulfoluna spongiiphila TaxID=419481 RepID=UPI001251084B|nr:ABC transporter ATP-binding protein [Desulfoluna spongiiphila]VVS94538.1 abc transporter type 1 transmembrane domain [Desulfoluna spongiiphila]
MDNQKSLLASGERRTLILAGLMLSLSVAAGIVPFVFVMELVRELAGPTPERQAVVLLLVGIVAVLTVKAMCYGAAHVLAHTTAFRVLATIRLKLVRHLERMNIGFFHKHKMGELTKILNFDVEQVELYLAHGLPEIASAILISFCATAIVTFIDYRLGLCLMGIVPLVIITNRILQRHWKEMFAAYFLSLKTMSEELMEYIATIPAIKAFSKTENRTEKVVRTMNAYNDYVRKMSLSMVVPAGISGVILEAGIAVLAVTGCLLLRRGDITLYELVLAVFLASAFCASLARLSLSKHFGIVFRNSSMNITKILNERPKECPSPADVKPGDIRLEQVSFSYEGNRDALTDVSLTIPGGSLVALTGVSGAGKSSVAHLIMGFFKPDKGRVLINGTDISSFTETQISAMISIVQQDVYLFNTTIRENIRIGKSNATDAEVEDAAKKARIHDFICSLPDGYDTLTGEKGTRISGGERQRIAIARALLKDAPIIILDEATSSVDAMNETLIQKAVNELRSGKTVIMITHHLSTIVNADRIFLLNNGRLVGQDTHAGLYRDNALYRHLWNEKSSADTWTIKEAH